MTILLEAYSGKTSDMRNAEKAMELLIREMHKGYNANDPKYLENKATQINASKHLRDVEKHLNKEFKFKSLSIQFPIVDVFHPNSGPHTIPSSFMFFQKSPKFSDADVFVFMDIPTIVYNNLTAAETIAIILHEIGHNIDMSTPTRFKIYYQTFSTLGIFPLVAEVLRHGKTSVNTAIDSILSNSMSRKFIMEFQLFIQDIESLLRIMNLLDLKRYLKMATRQVLSGIHLGYYGERKADSVAVQYGYGTELVNALNKLQHDNEENVSGGIIQSNPITGLMYDFTDSMFSIMFLLLAPHPATINRANNALYKLKSDINDPNIPPKLKKEIQKEIKELEKIIKDMNTPSFRKGNYKVFRALVNRVLSMGKGRNRNILDLLHSAEKYES